MLSDASSISSRFVSELNKNNSTKLDKKNMYYFIMYTICFILLFNGMTQLVNF